MKKPSKNINNKDLDITNTVSIVDGDEVVKRDSDEYIYLEAMDGVVDQAEEIETIKNRQAIDVLKNGLLGRFNAETGKYEISADIEIELTKIVKVETSIKGNAIFAESLSSFGGLGKFEFVVKTDVINGEATSELFIFESVKKMAKTVTNTQIQLVGVFKKSNELFVDLQSLTRENYYKEMYNHFKIIKSNQAMFISEDEQFLQGWIVRRKLYLKSMGASLDATIETAESDLLLNRIEILSTLGEYGYKVIERFEELKSQAQKIVKKGKLSARDQNEILEEAIETFRGKYHNEQEIFFKEQVDSVREYAQAISKAKEKNHKQILEDIEQRLPTVVEIIRRDDDRRLEQVKLGEKESDVIIASNKEPKTIADKPLNQAQPKTLEVKEQKVNVPPSVENPVAPAPSKVEKPQSVTPIVEQPSVEKPNVSFKDFKSINDTGSSREYGSQGVSDKKPLTSNAPVPKIKNEELDKKEVKNDNGKTIEQPGKPAGKEKTEKEQKQLKEEQNKSITDAVMAAVGNASGLLKRVVENAQKQKKRKERETQQQNNGSEQETDKTLAKENWGLNDPPNNVQVVQMDELVGNNIKLSPQNNNDQAKTIGHKKSNN